ncbi:MAG: tetratricopeptide repeat protein [Gammaproteobacteria bacterium]|nr:tetratricopeptide repeat protein [Gammaproteobacteria bacterium]
MNISKHISATAFLAAASLGMSPAAWALGLGDASVESFLNQPLQARIDLITRETDDLATVRASLASAADYEMIGASRAQMPVPIKFTIEDIDGDAYLRATSSLPIADPVVRLIVEVNWANGRMLREYTLFLDPSTVPSAAPPPRLPASPPPAAAAPVPAPASEPAPAAAESAPTATPAPAPVTERASPSTGDYGPVRSGETLWGIARDWSAGTGMDINKVMIAIQRENPEAFLKDNINLLKRGAILRMPAAGDVDRISRAAAYSEVEAQTEAFTGRRGRESAASADTPLISEAAAPPPVAEPDIEPAAESVSEAEPEAAMDQAADALAEEVEEAAEAVTDTVSDAMEEVTPEPRDQLELVPPSEAEISESATGFEEDPESAGVVAAADDLRENLARTEEELVNQQQQNAYLEERIQELERQLQETQQGSVEDADMASMEERLRQERRAEVEIAKPWYSRFGYWLLGLLVLAAAAVGWVISRRGAAAAEEEALSDIKDEAEEVLRVLGDEPAAAPPAEAPEEDESGEEEEAAPARAPVDDADEDAELLDEESSDPEIQLDLARAYISMGDKEAARVILEEVISNGTEEQQAEAQTMMKHL